jgi:hypothetical protein
MRPLAILPIVLTLFAAGAFAQEEPAAAPPRHRVTWEQRFAHANASHDGHLTLEEAQQGYKTVARHFREIDLDGKGFVTEDEIRAWHKIKRVTHRQSPVAEDGLRPRPAYHRLFPDRRQFPDSIRQTVTRAEEPLPEPAAMPPTAMPPGESPPVAAPIAPEEPPHS